MRYGTGFVRYVLLRFERAGSWLIDGLISYGELVLRNNHPDYW